MRGRSVRGAVIVLAATAIAAVSGISLRGTGAAAYAGTSVTAGASASAAPAAINWGAPEFTDNFNGTTLGKSWSVYDSPNAPVRRTKDSVRVSGGYLQLIGHHEAPYGYVGGGIAYNTNQLYGRWEVRFRADAGYGYDPIVLLWPKGTWPTDGEIDAIEMPNGSRQGANEWVHRGALNQQIPNKIPSTVDFTKWHTITVDWLPDHITFWLDGKAVWTVKRPSGTGYNYIPSTPFHLALQNDEGCDKYCPPNKTTPAKVTMQVDWVKIFAMPRPAPSPVTATAYSPDGKYLATADGKGHVYVRTVPGYKLKETLTDPATRGINSLAFTSRSHYVAAADGNGKVYLWTIANKTLNATVTDPASKGVRGVSFTMDGKTMASADANGHTYIFAEPNYKLVTTLANPGSSAVTATAYSPDGKYLATADGKGHVYVRTVPGYKLKQTLTDKATKGINSLAFTSASHYVAAADGNGKVYLWTIANGTLNATVTDPASKGVRGVSFTMDGKTMASADANGHAYIWAEPNYKLVTTLTNPAGS